MAKSGWGTNPDRRAPGFPEQDYKKSLDGDAPTSEKAKDDGKATGPNDPGYGKAR